MILGVDEVGRGCLAGPVVAGAVILDPKRPIRGLKDSKKLTRQQRTVFDARIRQRALAIGIGWATHAEIDEHGLTHAVRLAMQRAVAEITHEYEQLIIDGSYNFLKENQKSICVIKADDTIPAVSAASIVAKVARDTYMIKMAAEYPGYQFENHVGYATTAHQTALESLGLCDLHRRSFASIRAMM